MSKVHIVNHTHWDREWYFTSMDALVLSDQLFTDALDELKKKPEASFVLDGQLSILDDYVALYPERVALIKELVTNEQLFIGPWYTQSDACFTSGESILRNAMIGIFESKKYGKSMRLGYLPDTFGFNAQLPVILNEAGMDNVIMWRGLHLNKHVKSPYFKWVGLGGKNTVYALNLPQGYGTGMLLEPSVDYVYGRLDPAVDFIKQYTDGDILIPSGNDQLAIIHDFSEKVDKINELGKYDYVVSTYQRFLKNIKNTDLEEYQGEFREPVLARVHKTIGSVRMDLKKAAFHVEDKLVYRIEPLMVIAKKLGIHLSNRLLILAWKKLLESQAHDSLAGCVSDTVADDIRHRLKEANEICDSIENTIMKQLSDHLDLTSYEILVVNPSSNHFDGTKTVTILSAKPNVVFEKVESRVVSSEYVKSRENILEETPAGNRYITEAGYYILTVEVKCELPGLGYRVFSFKESDKEPQIISDYNNEITGGKVSIQFDGEKVNIKDGDITIHDFIRLIDEGNEGDTYDFSPQKGTSPITLSFNRCVCERDNEEQRMILNGQVSLPYTLEERLNNKYNQLFEYKLTLAISANDEIRGKVEFVNTILNHRMRLQLATSETIKSAKAGVPYGFIERKNQDLDNWQDVYSEMPVNVEPFEKVLSVRDLQGSLNIFTRDSREYEYSKNNVWITLLATTDSLGKPNLAYRPGRASGDTTKKGHVMMATPAAQLKNHQISFEFVVRFDSPDIDEDTLSWWKDRYLQPSISYQKQDLNYFVHRIDNKIQQFTTALKTTDKEFKLLDFRDHPCHVASIYNSYYQTDAFVIRIENPTNQEVRLPLDKLFDGYRYERINALEEPIAMTDTISEYSVLTFLLKQN